MKGYAQLGHVFRTEPCVEYPGEWLVFIEGKESGSFDSFDIVFKFAEEKEEASICWSCSDNDPRVGEVWFTGFYQHGRFDQFGRYKT